MHVIDSLMQFLVFVFNANMTIDGHKFSLVGAICFAGAVAIFIHVIHWLFDGD